MKKIIRAIKIKFASKNNSTSDQRKKSKFIDEFNSSLDNLIIELKNKILKESNTLLAKFKLSLAELNEQMKLVEGSEDYFEALQMCIDNFKIKEIKDNNFDKMVDEIKLKITEFEIIEEEQVNGFINKLEDEISSNELRIWKKSFNETISNFNTLNIIINALEKSGNVDYLDFSIKLKTLINQFTKEYGITIIDPSVGDEFDPNLHKMVTLDEDNNTGITTITSLVKEGYEYKGSLIEQAEVKISK